MGYHGIIQLLYSLILTRGIDTIKDEDMDESDVRLIGRHGYCTQVWCSCYSAVLTSSSDAHMEPQQEMVNLILTGQAISNVFDGDVRLDEGADGGGRLLKGIKRPVQFGYLTLFEHYGSLKVRRLLMSLASPQIYRELEPNQKA